jgi:Domain of unknown function (DUF5666)
MRRKFGTMSVLGAASVCALVLASAASAATLSWTVVHKNQRAQSFVLAGRGGTLSAVHAKRMPAIGRKVSATARRLRNGTWVATRIKVGKTAKRVRVRGTVTYVNTRRNTFVVSARGVSLLVHRHGAKRHSAHAASAAGTHVGDIVTVEGTPNGGSLTASQVQSDGHDLNGLDLEGVVQAVDTPNSTLTISADDSEQSGATLTVHVPFAFNLGLFQPGQSVELIVSPDPDGSYTLEQSSNDSGSHHADNGLEEQGNGHGDQRPSAEQACAAQQADTGFASSHNGLGFTQFYETDPNKPEDAFSRCVDAMAHGDSSNPSPELQCHVESSDPNFATSHNGLTFVQFYDPHAGKPEDAYKNCIDAKAPHHDGHGPGGDGSGDSGPGGSGSAGSALGSHGSGGPS